MRIAAISDVHGNIWALEAVLADLRKYDVDDLVNAGDLLSGPLEPAATADLLMSLHAHTVAGNHERQLLACQHATGSASDQHAFAQLQTRHLAWLRTLPSRLLGDSPVFLCHGTPRDDRVYFAEEVDPSGAIVPASAEALEARAAGVDRELIVCGHSHQQQVRSLSGKRLVVNPGSVGLQAYDDDHPRHHAVENGSPHARYALCDRTRDGWDVTFRCVPYDHLAAAALARRNGRDDWARWLETGRA